MARAGLALLGGWAALFLSGTARAETYTADFSSTGQWDSASSKLGIWNIVDRRVQAPVAANGHELDFGDGSDGDFLDGPAQTGITVAGGVITVNTDLKPVLKFKSFTLSFGKTLAATGSLPLKIRVLGPVLIAGTVNLSGSDGTDNSPSGIGVVGGASGVGGGRGGNGGFGITGANTQPTAGAPTGPGSVVGGGSGTNMGDFAQQGGGGGCNGLDGGFAPTDGDGGGVAGGLAASCNLSRTAVATAFDTTFRGGSGGGGGGAHLSGGAAATASGAGGGGGGGAILLSSLGAISFTDSLAHVGTIRVSGGDGGANENPAAGQAPNNCGGGGGGGSGGSIWLQSASTIAAGTLDTSRGNGLVNTACGGFYGGGNGAPGIIRADLPSGVYAGSQLAQTVAILASSTYTVVSKPIALTYGYSAVGTPTETFDTTSSGCGTGATTVTYEGSSNGTTFEHPVPKERITELNDYAYIRFKATLDTASGTPRCLTGLSIPFGPRELADLQLKGGLFCGSLNTRTGGRGGGGSPLEAAGDLLVIAAAVGFAFIRVRRSAAAAG